MAHETHNRVIALGTGIGEENMLETLWQNRRNLGGQLCGGHRRCLEKRVVIRQIQHLSVSRISQFLAAITHIHTPEARHAIQNLVTLAIPDVNPVGMGDDTGTARSVKRLMIRERMKMMGDVVLYDFFDIDVLLMD